MYISQEVQRVYSCHHLHSTLHEYLRRSGWSLVCPLKFAEQVSHVHVPQYRREMIYVFWRGFYAFSNEICAWLHNKAFKFFMFIYMFLGAGSFSFEKLWRPPCLFHLTWSLEATFWLPDPSTCGAYVILLLLHMIRKWNKALDQQSEALWIPFREREKG